jgi:BMFP domain-containing protein YqiC
MSMREREGVIARIRQIRRASAGADQQAQPSATGSERDDLRALQERVAHLEQVVEGLQDSVHRESTRLSQRIGELEARIQPAALGRALSDDARKRGL